MKKIVERLMLLSAVLLSTNIYAQHALEIHALDQPVMVDCLLDDQWMQADSVVQLVQMEPSTGAQASRRTSVRVAQYGQDIYFSWVNYINPEENVVARIQRRDQLNDSDDIVSVLIDPILISGTGRQKLQYPNIIG